LDKHLLDSYFTFLNHDLKINRKKTNKKNNAHILDGVKERLSGTFSSKAFLLHKMVDGGGSSLIPKGKRKSI
jgi:hypothetical protein